jgi:DNA-binding phage protein
MRRTDDHHHSKHEVARYLADALELVDEHELEAEVRAAAVSTAMTLLASKQIFYEQAAPIPADLAKVLRG